MRGSVVPAEGFTLLGPLTRLLHILSSEETSFFISNPAILYTI